MTSVPIDIKISSNDDSVGKRVVRTLDDIQKKAAQTKQGVAGFGSAWQNTSKQVAQSVGSVYSLRNALYGLTSVLGVREVIALSDAWRNTEARLKVVTNSAKNLTAVQRSLFEMSQRTFSSFEATSGLYIKMAMSSKQLGTSQAGILRFSELVNKSLQVSGSSATESRSAMVQLSQAMASGVLRGDEFNAIMENAPVLQMALQNSLKKTSGELRAMAEKGQLSAKVVYDALLKGGNNIDKMFKEMPLTAGRAWQYLSNAAEKYVGTQQGVLSSVTLLSKAMILIGDNINELVNGVFALTAALGIRYVAAVVAARAATFTLEAAMLSLRAVMATIVPVALIAGAIYIVLNHFDTLKKVGITVSAALATGFYAAGKGVWLLGTMIKDVLFVTMDELAKKVFTLGHNMKALFTGEGMKEYGNSNIAGRIAASASKALDDYKKDVKDFSKAAVEWVDDESFAIDKETKAREALSDASTKGLGATAKGTKEVAKETRTLASELQSLQQKYEADIATANMNDFEAAVFGVSEEVRNLTKEFGALSTEQSKQVEHIKVLAQQGVAAKKIQEIIKDTRNPQEEFIDQLREIEQLRPYAKTAQEVDALNRKLEELKEGASKEIAQVYKDIASGITDSFTKAFRGILDGNGGFKSIMKSIRETFKDTLARMATLAIMKPIIVPMVGALGGVMGMSQGSVGKVLGEMGGGGSSSSSLFSAGASIAGKVGAVTGAMNGWAAGALPSLFGTGAPISAAVAGPAAPGMLTGMGMSFSSLALPVAGIALGLLATKLMKKKPSAKEQTGVVDLMSGDISSRIGQTGKKFSQENYDTVTTLAQTLSGVAGSIDDFSGIAPRVRVNARQGMGFEFENGQTTWAGTVNGLIGNFTKALEKRFPEKMTESVRHAIQNIDWGSTEDEMQAALKDLQFAIDLPKILGDVEDKTTAWTQTLSQIDTQFDDYKDTMERLKYGVAELTKLENQRTRAIVTAKQAMQTSALQDFLSINDSVVNEFATLVQNYQAQVKNFQSAGLSTETLDKTFQIRQQQLLNELRADEISSLEDQISATEDLVGTYQDLSNSLQKSINNLRLGSLSPLSNEQQYNEAKSIFQQTASKAALGDTAAMEELSSAATTFLEISRSRFASADQYAADFASVEAALNRAKEVADRQVSIQQAMLNTATATLNAIQNGTSSVIAALTQKTASIVNGSMQVSSGNANETLVSGIRSGKIDMEKYGSVINSALNLVGAPASDGKGSRSSYFETNSVANSMFVQTMRSYGIPGFQRGGAVSPDSVFMVGETSPELYRSGSGGGKVIPIENGQNLEAKIAKLEAEQQETNRILREGFTRSIDIQAKQVEAITDNSILLKRANS